MAINPPVSSGDLVQCVFRMDGLRSQAGINVHGFQITSVTAPAPGLQDIAQGLFAKFAPFYAALMATNGQFTSVTARRIFPVPYSPTVSSLQVPTAGVVSGGSLDQQASGLVTKLSMFAGRKGRGRMYVPFPAALNNTTAGQPSTAYLSNLTLLGTALATPFTITVAGGSATLQWVMLKPPLPGSTVWGVVTVADFIVRPAWATQRRRSDFGRLNPPSI